jgi:hypothetical protein
MRAVIASAVVAATAATAPVIDLNMQGAVGAFKLAASIYRTHDLGYMTQAGDTQTAVSSRQDWTEKCIADKVCVTGDAGRDACTDRCPFPVAKAYDHQDGKGVEVTTRIFLVDVDGTTENTQLNGGANAHNNVDFTQRSTYLFKYDSHDKAGNRAEQIVFALIIDDQEAPRITVCDGVAETVEAATDWTLCGSSTSHDNIDGDISAGIQYTIAQIGTTAACNVNSGYPEYPAFYPVTLATHAEAVTSITTRTPGKFLVTLTSEDQAGVYGRNAANNVATARKAVIVQDTLAPWINVVGADPVYHQCTRYTAIAASPFQGTDYTDAGALTSDNLDNDAGRKVGDAGYGLGNGCNELDNVEGNQAQVTGLGNVVVSVIEDYTITFDHTDCAGNPAEQQSRVVMVRDTVGPTVHLIGDVNVDYHHEAGNIGSNHDATSLETGAEAFDLCDPGIPAELEGSGNGWKCTETSRLGDGVAFSVRSHATGVDAQNDQPECKMTWNREGFRLSGQNGTANYGGENSDQSGQDGAPLGTYIRTYTVQDHTGNFGHTVRTFNVLDNQAPTITCVKAEGAADCDETHEATHDKEYTDKGATCADYVDGELAHAVEISGQVVNMRIPSTYTINYDCKDLSGNPAPQVQRTVIVEDTRCPNITLTDPAVVYIEAGFPYVDTGATATDDLDGDITALITTDGDTVNTASAFYSRRSCKGIYDSYTETNTADDTRPPLGCGSYYITTQDTNGDYDRTLVWCDMANDQATYYFTVTDTAVNPADSAQRVAECAAKGMVDFTARSGTSYDNILTHLGSASAQPYGLDAVSKDQFENSATCTFATEPVYDAEDGARDGTILPYLNDDQLHAEISGHVSAGTNNSPHNDATGQRNGKLNNKAETGKYLIQFHVVDNAENKECNTQVRTVVVRDTLRPVISLHLGHTVDYIHGVKKLIHTSDHTDKGLNGEVNPAGLDRVSGMDVPTHMEAATYGNPHLHDEGYMAEQSQASSANGWIVGAAASAVTGLALLGFSQRKSTVTTVPV